MDWQALVAATVNPATRDEFGRSVSYTPASTGVAETIRAVFDAAAQLVEYVDGIPTTGTGPVLDVVLADLSVMPRGRQVGTGTTPDRVVVSGITYAVVKVEPSGHGTAKLYLAKGA